MFRVLFSLVLMLFSVSIFSNSSGDEKLLNLSMASLACAAVQKVNPNVVDSNYPDYFKNAVKTYSLYHSVAFDIAEKNERSMYNLMTGESAIKVQKLNSIADAKIYLDKFLYKTNAKTCAETPAQIKNILGKYEITL